MAQIQRLKSPLPAIILISSIILTPGAKWKNMVPYEMLTPYLHPCQVEKGQDSQTECSEE
jgi:hypothetical protein